MDKNIISFSSILKNKALTTSFSVTHRLKPFFYKKEILEKSQILKTINNNNNQIYNNWGKNDTN